MNDSVITLLGSIGANYQFIQTLLREKKQKIRQVQTAMEQKARNKTPLDERQQQTFHELTGVYAREGGSLRQSLMDMDSTLKRNIETHSALHNRGTDAVVQSLTQLRAHQRNAIHSLRRLIAFSENTLQLLQASPA